MQSQFPVVIHHSPTERWMLHTSAFGIFVVVGWLIAAGSILVVVGFLDDVFELGVKTRFFAQLVATLVMLASTDLWITSEDIRMACKVDWIIPVSNRGRDMNLSNFKSKALSNAEVKAEYDKLKDEFGLIHQLISMCSKAGLTQEQLAGVMKTQKSNISRLENGRTNLSWATVLKYAHACGFELKLQSQKIS